MLSFVKSSKPKIYAMTAAAMLIVIPQIAIHAMCHSVTSVNL